MGDNQEPPDISVAEEQQPNVPDPRKDPLWPEFCVFLANLSLECGHAFFWYPLWQGFQAGRECQRRLMELDLHEHKQEVKQLRKQIQEHCELLLKKAERRE